MSSRGERLAERKSLESLWCERAAAEGPTLPAMPSASRVVLSDSRGRAFDVICAGEAPVSLAPDGASVPEPSLRFRLGGGAVSAALSLARQGLRVGLSTVLSDDALGRGLEERIAGEGVDVGGVEFAQPSSGIMFVRGGARQVVVVHDVERPIAIPEGWTSQVLLLSGMSPVVWRPRCARHHRRRSRRGRRVRDGHLRGARAGRACRRDERRALDACPGAWPRGSDRARRAHQRALIGSPRSRRARRLATTLGTMEATRMTTVASSDMKCGMWRTPDVSILSPAKHRIAPRP